MPTRIIINDITEMTPSTGSTIHKKRTVIRTVRDGKPFTVTDIYEFCDALKASGVRPDTRVTFRNVSIGGGPYTEFEAVADELADPPVV